MDEPPTLPPPNQGLTILRSIARRLPPGLVFYFLWPAAFCLAWLEVPRIHRVRACFLGSGRPLAHIAAQPLLRWVRARARHHLHRILMCLPDHLLEAPWQRRFRLTGDATTLENLNLPGPKLLVTLHFGVAMPLRYFLRAAGIPVASWVAEQVKDRRPSRLWKDHWASRADGLEIPHAFSGKFPIGARRHLAQGGKLLCFLDHGQSPLLSLQGGWQPAEAPFRMALKADSPLIPVLMREEAPWRFTIHLGPPVIVQEGNPETAARHLEKWFRQHCDAHPEEGYEEYHTTLSSCQPVQ